MTIQFVRRYDATDSQLRNLLQHGHVFDVDNRCRFCGLEKDQYLMDTEPTMVACLDDVVDHQLSILESHGWLTLLCPRGQRR